MSDPRICYVFKEYLRIRILCQISYVEDKKIGFPIYVISSWWNPPNAKSMIFKIIVQNVCFNSSHFTQLGNAITLF